MPAALTGRLHAQGRDLHGLNPGLVDVASASMDWVGARPSRPTTVRLAASAWAVVATRTWCSGEGGAATAVSQPAAMTGAAIIARTPSGRGALCSAVWPASREASMVAAWTCPIAVRSSARAGRTKPPDAWGLSWSCSAQS